MQWVPQAPYIHINLHNRYRKFKNEYQALFRKSRTNTTAYRRIKKEKYRARSAAAARAQGDLGILG